MPLSPQNQKEVNDLYASFPVSKAIILLGGPHQQENHFRPLSLDLPKPLFPVAGREMLYHHLEACSKVPNLQEIILIGSYDEGLFLRFFDLVLRQLNVHVRYMREKKALGTAGGIRFFHDDIINNNNNDNKIPSCFYILHCDICCTFPLNEMMYFHLSHGGDCTLLGKKIYHNEVNKYGCLVQDTETKEILHWAEKPETFVSDKINCGIYLINRSLLDHIVTIGNDISRKRRGSSASIATLHLTDNMKINDSEQQPLSLNSLKDLFPDFINNDNLRLEQDILMPLAGKKKVYLYETDDFWCQIKTPGMAIVCSELYMQRFRFINPSLLMQENSNKDQENNNMNKKNIPFIEGNVVIDSSAEVHPSAKLGPNVCIAAGVKIGPGVRIAHSIILENVIIKRHACILFSIIGWNSIIGSWSRIEGTPPNISTTHSKTNTEITSLSRDITIFGVSVVAKPEIIVRNCIVLPHKCLETSYHNEILL